VSTIDEKILKRIKRLLALSRSSNQHEAALAATKAQALLTEHNLSEAAVNLDEGDSSVTHSGISMGGARLTVWLLTLGQGVAKGCYCTCLSGRDRLVFVGRPTDVETAKDLFAWLKEQGERFLLESLPKRPARIHQQTWRASFLQGYAEFVSGRLILAARENTAQHGEAGTALVRHSEAQNVAYAERELAVGKAKKKVNAANANIRAYYAGMEAGNKVALAGGQLDG
jgi:hypothetical protein